MNKVAPWITVKVDPDFIGNWATEDLVKETNKKNDAHKKLVAKGKNATKEEWGAQTRNRRRVERLVKTQREKH